MDKLLANERVLRALITQAQETLYDAKTYVRSITDHPDGGTWDWLDVKEELNKAMRDLVFATAVIDELWRTAVYRAAHSVEDRKVTEAELQGNAKREGF
jgi:hypothetical protein